jgi:hypothetical protein
MRNQYFFYPFFSRFFSSFSRPQPLSFPTRPLPTQQIIRTLTTQALLSKRKTPLKPKPRTAAALIATTAMAAATSLYIIENQNPEKKLLTLSKPPKKQPLGKSHTEDSFTKTVNEYIQKYFGELHLPPAVLEQLAMFQASSIKTSESNVRLADKVEDSLHIEIKRSLSRWNCLRLLVKASPEAYQQFIAHQPEDDKLSYESFKKLAALLTRKPSLLQAVEASCFIAISDKAKALAKEKKASFSFDSEKFLSDTIVQCPEINPILSILNTETKALLPFVYLPDTHGRHMLYTEGGNNMFATLREKLRTGSITQDQYQAWLGRWIINIAGFRGHEDPQGSIYLTEKTAQTLLTLSQELEVLQHNPQYDILRGYLNKRAEQLGLSSLYLAHLGSSMRLYTAAEGKELQAWFDRLPTNAQKQYENAYQELRENLETTPTYEVAVMDNLRSLGCSIAETISIHSQISAKAAKAYQEAIAQHKIHSKTPLCYRDFAFKNNLVPLLETYRSTGKLPEIQLDDQGNVMQKPQALEPQAVPANLLRR